MAAQQESGAIRVRRIYEPPDGGYRVLVDRLWPRGVSKARADLDEWLKDLAPSTGLRTWFAHREGLWEQFEDRFRRELADNPLVAGFARDCASRPDTVLLPPRPRPTCFGCCSALASGFPHWFPPFDTCCDWCDLMSAQEHQRVGTRVAHPHIRPLHPLRTVEAGRCFNRSTPSIRPKMQPGPQSVACTTSKYSCGSTTAQRASAL